MPTQVFFPGGLEVTVTADIDTVVTLIERRGGVARFERFAGFHGDEVVGGEPIAIRTDAVAYMKAVPAP